MAIYYQPLIGGYIVVEDELDEDGDRPVRHRLNAAKLRRGIEIIAEKYPHHLGAVIADQYKQDAETGDVLIQCALFGEIKYA